MTLVECAEALAQQAAARCEDCKWAQVFGTDYLCKRHVDAQNAANEERRRRPDLDVATEAGLRGRNSEPNPAADWEGRGPWPRPDEEV